mmetsp:Transcript_19754/g.52811  ORF Transcript_19754/g.52811 Transcript_19754/m.52811 type:complete len:89 (-) Transcript_19754:1207-1473(-)
MFSSSSWARSARGVEKPVLTRSQPLQLHTEEPTFTLKQNCEEKLDLPRVTLDRILIAALAHQCHGAYLDTECNDTGSRTTDLPPTWSP